MEHVDTGAGEADKGGVALVAVGAFAVVVGSADRVVQGGERGEEECALELLVAGSARVLTTDRGARAPRDGRESGVGSQVAGGGESGAIADFEEDASSGPDADAGHRGQDQGKRGDRKSTRLNSSQVATDDAVFSAKKK